jgi:hypothetical protein
MVRFSRALAGPVVALVGGVRDRERSLLSGAATNPGGPPGLLQAGQSLRQGRFVVRESDAHHPVGATRLVLMSTRS